MPEIDVTEVLLGSDIAGTRFDVVRRREIVGNDGISRLYEARVLSVIGSVTPVGDNSLLREEAYSTQHKAVMVVTPFRLRGAARDSSGSNWQPDLVLWRGGYYIVRTVEDYSQFGVGMIAADCESFTYVPQPPRQLVPPVGEVDFRQPGNSALETVI